MIIYTNFTEMKNKFSQPACKENIDLQFRRIQQYVIINELLGLGEKLTV